MRLRWSPEAASNLDEIHEYLVTEHSPFAPSTIKTIYEAIRALRDMPYRGRQGRIEGTRELVLSKLPFIVVYRVSEDAVHVISIRHAARRPLG